MMQFEAIEVMGRERREALAAEAQNHRLTRSSRRQARQKLVNKMASVALSIRRPGLWSRHRPADWDLPVPQPARGPT
jgi:hypothetical protein